MWRVLCLLCASLAAQSLVPIAIAPVPRLSSAIASDTQGNYYVAGNSGTQIQVMKFDPFGKLIYSRVFGGSVDDSPSGIAVDATGSAYVFGYTSSPDFPVVNGYLTTGSLFVTKLSPDGSTILYSTFVAKGRPGAIAVDAAGNAYVTGRAAASDLTTTPGALMSGAQLASAAAAVFVVKIAADGSRPVWSTFLAGNGIGCLSLPGVSCPMPNPGYEFLPVEVDLGQAIAVDASGAVYVGGYTNSAGFPVTPGVVQPQYGDSSGTEAQGFVTKISPDGSSLMYSTYLGNEQGEAVAALAVDSQGNAIVGLQTYQIALNPEPGWPPSPLPQCTCDFVVKLDPQAASIVYLREEVYTARSLVVDQDGNAYVSVSTYGGTPPGPNGFNAALVELDPNGAQVASTPMPAAATLTLGSGSVAALTGSSLTILSPGDDTGPAVYAIQNAANVNDYSGQVAPGEIVLLTGINLGSRPAVTFDAIPAPVFAPPTVSNQALIQVPFEIEGRQSTTMAIGNRTLALAVVPSAPGVFTIPGYGVTPPINADGTLNGPNNPAALGSMMTVFVTGAGVWSGGLGTGDVAPLQPFYSPQLPISVYIQLGNSLFPAQVLYAGSAPTQSDGVMQVNFTVPSSRDLILNNFGAVVVQVGSAQSQPGVFVSTKLGS